jgi:flagellar basal body-associated protein FliL
MDKATKILILVLAVIGAIAAIGMLARWCMHAMGGRMNFLWIAIPLLLVLCCVAMALIGRHSSSPRPSDRGHADRESELTNRQEHERRTIK